MSRSKPETVGNHWHSSLKWCEVVRVDSPVLLVNSRQHACHYATADDEPLAAGYYLALWPAGSSLSFYGRELFYFGPLASKSAALLLHASALWLGMADAGVEGGHTSSFAPPAASHWQQAHQAGSQIPGEDSVQR